METLLNFVAAGGTVTTALLIYYVYKIEPRLRSMEQTQLQGQQVDLLKLVRDLSHVPEAADKAKFLLEQTGQKLKELS